ncbi:MAG: tetratricopeptide repeat protein, partial [Planctomycetota bacterium]
QELVANKDFDRAKGSFEKTLELSPDLPKALEGLGRTYARLGDREKAGELLEKFKEVKPDEQTPLSGDELFTMELVEYSDKYKDAAQVFLAGNENAKAQVILEKAVILSGANMDAWSSLLGLYQRTGQLSRAKSMSVVMCEENSDNAGAFFTSGVIHAKSGESTKAAELYERVIELAPESDTGYTALARLLLQSRQQPNRILELTGKAVELNPIAANYELLGQAQAISGKMQEAHSSLSKAIELSPDNEGYKQAMQQLEAFLSQNK